MSRKRLSKKQLRRDKFVERTFDWAHWAETHRAQVVAGVVAIVVLAGALFVYRQMSRAAEEEAALDYMTARQAYFAGNYPLAASDLQAFLREHGGSSYADDARFFRGDALYEAGDDAGAVEALTEFLDRHGDSPFAPSARRVSGAAYLRLGRHAEAVAAYRAALEEAEYDGERVQIHRALAEVYEAQGETAAAVAEHRAILELEPDGEAAREATRDIAELTVQPLSAGTEGAAPAVGATGGGAAPAAPEGESR